MTKKMDTPTFQSPDEAAYEPKYYVPHEKVVETLRDYMLVDGFDMSLDLHKSNGCKIVDSMHKREFMDMFTGFASMPVGFNHPKLMDAKFIEYLGKIAINKPANSDVYTDVMATFVKTMFRVAVPDHFKYSFFIEGGSLAVENALKTAFDWKVRQNFRKGYQSERGNKIIHFEKAFHGRSGYTLSLTNTDPQKINYFPKFDWPRIPVPMIDFPLTPLHLEQVIEKEALSIEKIKQSFFENNDDIAAIIIEPIQGEGGDNHFRPEFMKALRDLADENHALLIFDEVQTGVGLTGSMWCHQQLGVNPDIMCFGKKMQVCGILVGDKVDIEPENVFHQSSRINSTWGGNLIDMARATKYLEIIEEEKLVENAKVHGEYLINKIHGIEKAHPNLVSNVRGRGLFCAFRMPNAELRNEFRMHCYEKGLIILGCGNQSVRFRPPLNITKPAIDEAFKIIESALTLTTGQFYKDY